MSFTALSIYNFSKDQNIAEPQEKAVNWEKGTLITDLVVATLLIVAAVVLLVLDKMGVHTGLVGTIASASAGGAGLLIWIADQVTLAILYTRRPNEQRQDQVEIQKIEISKNPESEAKLKKEIERLAKVEMEFENVVKRFNEQNSELEKLKNEKTPVNTNIDDQLKQKDQEIEDLKSSNEKQKQENQKLAQELEKLKKDSSTFLSILKQLGKAKKELADLQKINERQKQELEKQTELAKKGREALEEKAKLAKSKAPTGPAKPEATVDVQWEIDTNLINMPLELKPRIKTLKEDEAFRVINNHSGTETYDVYYNMGPMFHVLKDVTKETWDNRKNHTILKSLHFIDLK